ncbi:MAG TPA: hypothetical protein VF768_09915, partial [Holophagaceae bacterium]
DALRYRWLKSAATLPPGHLPPDPFPPGPDRREAEALRALFRPEPQDLARHLAALPLHLPGTALALWRWGQDRVHRGAFTPALRRAWEDRLLSAGPILTRGYALRHALCWALAEHDETRFAALKTYRAQFSDDTFELFQRLFGLLGGPSPALRLWALPGLAYRDLRLDQLGAQRIWIQPAGAGALAPLPPGVAWIIPGADGMQDPRDADLTGASKSEGEALSMRLQAANLHAYLAPSVSDMERLGLVWFPALVTLDAQGFLKDIRMGDAAPDHP